jgi:hypothetical protein
MEGQTSTCVGADRRDHLKRNSIRCGSGPASGVGLFARRHFGFVGVLAAFALGYQAGELWSDRIGVR